MRRNQTTTDQPASVARRSSESSEGGPNFIHHPPDLARHRRKCSICRHPERETIEDLFIHWHSPNTIANYFDDTADAAEDAGDDSANRLRITWVAIYRHAYAVGLDEVRRRNLRFAFEHILEQAGDITPTSASIMAAARAYAACVNTAGHWNDPPKQVIVTNILKREAPLTAHDTRTTDHDPQSGSDAIATESRPPFSDCGGSTPLCLNPIPLRAVGSTGSFAPSLFATAAFLASSFVPPAFWRAAFAFGTHTHSPNLSSRLTLMHPPLTFIGRHFP